MAEAPGTLPHPEGCNCWPCRVDRMETPPRNYDKLVSDPCNCDFGAIHAWYCPARERDEEDEGEEEGQQVDLTDDIDVGLEIRRLVKSVQSNSELVNLVRKLLTEAEQANRKQDAYPDCSECGRPGR